VQFSRIRFLGCTRFRADLHSCPLQGPVAIPRSEVGLPLPDPTVSGTSFLIQEPSWLPGFSSASRPACHGLRTPADLHALAFDGRFVLPSAPSKTSASATSLFRSCTSSSGSAISPTAYRILCLRLAHLVRLVSRRYSAMDPRLDTGGWPALTGEPLGSSFPTGTFTRQDALSFSQRDNVGVTCPFSAFPPLFRLFRFFSAFPRYLLRFSGRCRGPVNVMLQSLSQFSAFRAE